MTAIRAFGAAFAVLTLTWALALPAAARVAAEPGAGVAPRAVAGLVYLAGRGLCHQRADRSFHVGDTPWPVCARCVGIYWGGAVAVVLVLATRRLVSSRHRSSTPQLRMWTMAALSVNATTLAYEWLGGHAPSNSVRALAGVSLGAVAAWIVLHATQPGRQSE